MSQRRSLVEGLKESPAINPDVEREFVLSGKQAKKPEPPTAPVATPDALSPNAQSRVPLSTRMRGDYAAALKRASLERQLSGTEPNTLIDILEQALEPWLRSNGYLK